MMTFSKIITAFITLNLSLIAHAAGPTDKLIIFDKKVTKLAGNSIGVEVLADGKTLFIMAPDALLRVLLP